MTDHLSSRPEGRRRSTHDRIRTALFRGPMHIRQLADAVGCDYTRLVSPLKTMKEDGRVVIVGKCGDHGITHWNTATVRADAPLYSLPGMKAVLPAEFKREPEKGSMAVYRRLVQHDDFKELKRDMFAHWRLCEVMRK